ncbi:tetratricopeptide repeat protein [Microcoleus sp. bin38.metabat.b11b12b14.051]|uniref:tetratricopeptide repeat protein n=1 Tax=Microcoleus sp. bin38.metabat.b11b12b14.051 TaxID=2742709 RepID=UPI0025E84C4B|nr:tetratricopeptide repeat protein [Microcoleus sp. bin38.metabat.b11b12b14.051]
MIKTLEAVIRRQWLPPEFAVREVVAFERRFGMKHLSLACHAALPLFLSPELVNLININFLDSENVSWIAESDFLLSPLCRPMDRGVFEVEPCVREVLLVELENRFGWRRPFEIADFLGIYLKNQPEWKQRPEQTRTQKWIAQAYLNPDRVVEELTDFLDESLPEENPILGLPGQIEIPKIVEILAEPLERTSIDLWSYRQYLVNTSRALAQIFYGEEEDLREKITEEKIQIKTGNRELMMLSPVIWNWLEDIAIKPVETTPIAVGRALIITCLNIEYIASCSHLTDLREEMHPQGTIYERGKFIANGKSWEVGIVKLGLGKMGVGVGVEAERAIAYFNPSVIMSVGVAGGIKDVAIGDVVAATKVYGYDESGKAKQKFQPRPDLGRSTYSLIQRSMAESKKSDWLQRLASAPNTTPRVFVAPIVAGGEKLITSRKSDVFKFIQLNYGDAVALEIEGGDLLQAAYANHQVSVLVVRGIFDWIDGKSKADARGSQEMAARNASAFAFEILAKLQIEEAGKASSEQSTLPLLLPKSAQTMNFGSTPPKVFISYSHDSQEHKESVLALADRFREDGIDCNIDQYEDSPPEGWQRWMLNQVEASDYALIVCTQQYDRRFRGQEETGKGKGVTWEGGVIIQELYDAQGKNSKFIPIAFTAQDSEFIPSPLRSATFYRLDTADGYESLYRRLTNQLRTPKPGVGILRTLPPRERKQLFREESQSTASESLQETQVRPLNFFALDDRWVGRDNLIRDLSDRIRSNCRLLMLVGITGIGKTALGERLAVEVADWFENDWSHYHQENFDDEQQTSDFASVAARWLEKWGELITPEDRKDTQRLLYRLVRHLTENRYLVQIDSLENLLQGNEEEGWSDFKDEWWVRFFESLLAADSCESCIILTSQDLPSQIPTIGTRYQNFWYCQPLSGLEERERLALFEKAGLEISINSPGRHYLERIGRAYEGYPLALRVIAGEIRNQPFDGNVVTYWNQYGREVEEVEKAIEEAKTKGITASADDKFNLHRYTRNLRRNVRFRLEKTFNRLQKDVRYAYILLCEASVYRCPVPEDFWLSHLEDWDRDEDEQQVALDALRDRYLVEEVVEGDRSLLRQHNLIRSVSLEHLKQLDEDDDREINITPDGELVLAKLGIDGNYIKGITLRHRRTQYKAVINWLTQYHPQPDASNLDKVRGYLEAFGHLCNVENWEAASKILLTRINTPSQEELYKQLGIWSYYREQIEVCSQILGKLNGSFDINLLNTLGNSYYILGDYRRAMDYLQQSLTIAREIQDDLGQENALVNLGKLYFLMGEYVRAIECHQHSLKIAQEIGDLRGKAQALTNLGSVYASLGNYSKTIEYSQQSLAIARQINNRFDEGQALANIGAFHLYQGEYEMAIEYYQQSLKIAREIGDRRGEEMALGSLGVVYESIGEYVQGIEYNQESLLIAQEIGDVRGEEQALANLGSVYANIGDYGKTIEYSQQSLAIAREIGNRQGEGEALGNIGFAYQSLGEYDRAISCYQHQLQIAREIGYILSEGEALCNLGNTLIQVENYVEALDYFQQSLNIFREIGSRANQAEALKSLAEVHQHLGHLDIAIEFGDMALAIATELGIPLANECQKLKDTLTTIERIDS